MKKALGIVAIALAAFALLGLSACEGILELLASPSLTVIDARTGNGINGVTVTLTPIAVEDGGSMSAVTGTSGSTGIVSLPDVDYGTYTVTGSLSGYVFIPFEATIAGWNTDLGKMFGVSTSKGGDTNAVSIFLTWGDTAKDIDAHFTYPAGFDTDMANRGAWTAADAYYPLDEITTRKHVYHLNKQTTSDFASLDVDDVNGEGPETISLLGSETGTTSGSTTAIDSDSPFIGSVLPAGNYDWMGAGEYYLDAWTTGSSLDTQDVRVVITQGSSIKGIFNLPSTLTLETISLFRVLMFYQGSNYFMVFMPDTRLLADNTTAIKSLGGIPNDSAFVVSGSK